MALPVVSDWRPEHVALIAQQPLPQMPVISGSDIRRLRDDLDVWDVWPVQHLEGAIARFDGARVWMGLTAPVMGDPAMRHSHARIHLIHEREGRFTDCGPALPDGFSPGACEWSGSAVLRAPGQVELYFTATGQRGQPWTHQQRLFVTTGTLTADGATARVSDWSRPQRLLPGDSAPYLPSNGQDLAPGLIPAMRDPALFHDPASGAEYVLFAANLADADPCYGRAIGMLESDGQGGWRDLGSLIRAEGVNHELERPHMVCHQGRYYVFWCTQSHMFAPDGPKGPTGLYAMVSDHPLGPYLPYKGSGLVLANPEAEPFQAYAWWVSGDLEVTGFVDLWGVHGLSETQRKAQSRARFGGCIAPILQLDLALGQASAGCTFV
jgi:levansucrase